MALSSLTLLQALSGKWVVSVSGRGGPVRIRRYVLERLRCSTPFHLRTESLPPSLWVPSPDEVGTKCDKKNAKHKAKEILKHKYYWLHKEEDILFNIMKAVYKIMNNQDKVTMKHSYHIICDPDLGKGLIAMQRIPCSFNGCVEQLSNP